MDWVLRIPQIHSTFGNLGFANGKSYHVYENCNETLETILHNILTEDKYLRTYRRTIFFGEHVKKDFIPLLNNAKEDRTIELLVKIFINLTLPVECLLSVELISQTEIGRHTIHELIYLLTSMKTAFIDPRTTKIIINFLKKNIHNEKNAKLSMEQCTNVSNCLLLLRNLLHISEDSSSPSPSYKGSKHPFQNQIIWNLFSQSFDEILIKLLAMPEATNWGVTMVQVIALLYKDQHVVILKKNLNLWLEASQSESSEDDESNTSPRNQGRHDSSPMLTSDSTSDLRDSGGSSKSNDEQSNGWNLTTAETPSDNNVNIEEKRNPVDNITEKQTSDNTTQLGNNSAENNKSEQNSQSKRNPTDTYDFKYRTRIENQESNSMSSDENIIPTKKPGHRKPRNLKQRVKNKPRPNVLLQFWKQKKVIKRVKVNIINIQGLSRETPTDDDISNIIKEFTVDFLLKGYNSLVQTLHAQILRNKQLEIDTSHFIWLITYFLQFAVQLELDLEYLCSVLSYDIVSYFIAEGVNLSEQFKLAIKLDSNDLKPIIRRLHQVITAIREFIHSIGVYKKNGNLSKNDQETLLKLQIKMCKSEQFRSLSLLLLRHYNSKYHSKQYLQDLITTNHILLTFLHSAMKLPDHSGPSHLLDHMKQFATRDVMSKYGLLLEDYARNGEFVNDCIFTMMHHVAGGLGCVVTLMQPNILKTFTSIRKSEFEICDDWSDLIEYVINTFVKKPQTLCSTIFRVDTEKFKDDNVFDKPITPTKLRTQTEEADNKNSGSPNTLEDSWTEEELSSLYWNYLQCSTLPDIIGGIIEMYKEKSIIKTRDSVIKKLLKQKIITNEEYEEFQKKRTGRTAQILQAHKEMKDNEIAKLCDQLTQDGKSKFLDWVQKVLLDTYFAKLCVEKKTISQNNVSIIQSDYKLSEFELFKKKSCESPEMLPESNHSPVLGQSVPLVPWNCEQASICNDWTFLQLLYKLGFHMVVDSGKAFIWIPHFWSAEYLYEVANKISPINNSKLKFPDEVTDGAILSSQRNSFLEASDLTADVDMTETPDNFYQMQKQNVATTVNLTPIPGTSVAAEGEGRLKQGWLKLLQISQEYNKSLADARSVMPFSTACPVVADMASGTRARSPKLLLALSHSSDCVIEKDEKADCMDVETQDSGASVGPPAPPRAASDAPTVPAASSLDLPADETGSKADFNLNPADLCYFNNTECETASVASDLTRMYVSDEDEADWLARPVTALNPLLDGRPSSDAEHEIARKRKRV